MPEGKVNLDLNTTGFTFKDGTPVDTTVEQFTRERGTPVTLPHDFGNDIPVSDATLNSNPVTWPTPDPAHFGNVDPEGAAQVCGTPTFLPIAGSYGPTQNVVISSTTSGASIYYTTDGSTPDNTKTLYSGPVSVAVSETLKAIAIKSGFTNSAVGSATYVINGQVATPTFSPVAGTYSSTQNVTISSSTAGSTFYYTTDGSNPTTGSTLYTGPISVSSSETLKVLAVKANYTDSNIGSAAYLITVFLTIVNAGFEADVLTPEGFTDNTFASGWIGTAPQAAEFGAWYISVAFEGIAAPEGNNVAYIGASPDDAEIHQTLADVWLASKTYTITFDSITVDNGGLSPSGGTVQFLNGATVLATSAVLFGPLLAAGVASSSFSYATPASGPMIGQPITIKFLSSIADEFQMCIDDVKMSYV